MNKTTGNNNQIFGVSLAKPLENNPGVAENLFDKAKERESIISICSLNPEILLRAKKDHEFRDMLNGFGERIIDGFGIQLVNFFKGEGLKKRFTGADLSRELLDFAKEKKLKVGAVIKEGGLSSRDDVERFFRRENADFIIFEKKNFQDKEAFLFSNGKELESVMILFVFLGAPQQEELLNDLGKIFSGPKVCICAGGTIDFWTEKTARAPKIFQKMGLEWLWRLLDQPNRIFRIWNAVAVFTFKAFFSKNETA